MKILCDSIIQYYKEKLQIDIYSLKVHQLFNSMKFHKTISSDSDISPLTNKRDGLLFLNLEKLLQTDSGFGVGECEAMMQLFIFIFAIIMTDQSIKSAFIEPIFEFQEEVQEDL